MHSKAEMEKQEMNQFAEPWKATQPHGCIVGSDCKDKALDCGMVHAERIVACVNSLAGIPNPEAVREVIEAATAVRNDFNHVTLARLYDAVESLSAPFPGAQQK